MHQQEVYVAFDISVAACGRAEYASVERLRIPRAKVLAQALPQFKTQISKHLGRRGGNMLPI
jgi:hypothetical protein